MGSGRLAVWRRFIELNLVSARKFLDLLSVLALGARERGQHEGIVFDILNLIQNLHFEDKEM